MRFCIRNLARAAAAALVAAALGPGLARAQTGTPIHVVTYQVQTGDTMSAIAEYFYTDQTRAPAIADYNRLTNMNRIGVGQDLSIPFYDSHMWAAYAERAGLDLAATGGGGGSEDVAVSPLREGGGRRWWAFAIYGSVAAGLSVALYIRSRRHADTALGLSSPRR